MAKFVKVILFLLLTVAFHSIAGNVSTEKMVDKQGCDITYAMGQRGEICAPDLPGKPVAELTNLQSHQMSVTRIQRVQLGEYFFSLKNALQGCADRENSLSQHWGRIYDTTTSFYWYCLFCGYWYLLYTGDTTSFYLYIFTNKLNFKYYGNYSND